MFFFLDLNKKIPEEICESLFDPTVLITYSIGLNEYENQNIKINRRVNH